jgi:hypothetical protein
LLARAHRYGKQAFPMSIHHSKKAAVSGMRRGANKSLQPQLAQGFQGIRPCITFVLIRNTMP